MPEREYGAGEYGAGSSFGWGKTGVSPFVESSPSVKRPSNFRIALARGGSGAAARQSQYATIFSAVHRLRSRR
jgi:hypothetical protein